CGHSGEFNGKRTSVPEYETTSLLGSNLGIFDIDKISEWNDKCGELGIDTISAGGTIAYVMEASEKGLLNSPLRFGNSDHITKTIEDISFSRGFGSEMAKGSRKLSEKYGGKEFCMTVKGLEMSAYHPEGSSGMGLNYAVANRGGCHLSSTIFGLEIDTNFLNPLKTYRKAIYVEMLENIFSGINSLHTCHFTIYPYMLESIRLRYIPKPLVKFFMLLLPSIAKLFIDVTMYSGLFSSVTGIKISAEDFLSSGKRIHVLERYLNTREGISIVDDTLPEKIISGGIRGKVQKPYPLQKMLHQYYKIRKYDENGIPRKSSLKRLGIDTEGKQIIT
ncbi:MAG: aldehyde ferredoxin oxidoreductase C-terminal domain-containing protein, partial [Candidatus Aminicenantes bacterium]|nr:aldehyde ferredoxin oxidoreductase C-terminal domain-containing protein [Candidatus Aminicenantes bacterium]